MSPCVVGAASPLSAYVRDVVIRVVVVALWPAYAVARVVVSAKCCWLLDMFLVYGEGESKEWLWDGAHSG